jgi:nucleoside-diphosphate-sugar epimerase
MSKVLVTGANGFLGKSISKHLSSAGHTVYALTRQGLDVSDENQVSKWFLNNEVDFVIHTAIKGGRRGSVDTYGDYVTNIKMFENLFDQRSKYSLMINFVSGAEFDRSNDI